jgi:tetratricopeptide (TPR) repeat protein
MSRLVVLGVALALLSAPSRRASAEPSDEGRAKGSASPSPSRESSGVAAAKQNYEAGVKAYQNGRHEDAIRFFTEADRLAPSAPLSFNIARVYERMGAGAQAFRYYRDYLRRAPGAANAAEVREIVKKHQTELADRGRQQLCVLSTPSGAAAIVNGSSVGATPWTGELEPGTYRIELHAPGFAPATRDVTLTLEQAEDVIVTLEATRAEPAATATPKAATPGTAAPSSALSSPEQREPAAKTDFGPWPWVAIGAGGAALSGALVFEVLRASSEDAARRETRQIAFSEKFDQMESRRTTARVLLSTGGALLLTGGVLLVVDAFGGDTDRTVGVGVSLEPRGAAANLSGVF